MKHNNIIRATLYFLASAILTGVFISKKFWLYSSADAMVLSGCIAGGKWLIQLLAALFLLKEKRGVFIRRIGFVCFIGSVIIFVYYIFDYLPVPLSGFSQFIVSIGLSVCIMIVLYYKAVQKTGLGIKWFLAWLACLAAAIFLQVNIVYL